MKTHIFVDFWNLQLTINDIDPKYRLDWKKISPWLIQETSILFGCSVSFQGIHVYMSYNSGSKKDALLIDFAQNTLSRFPGFSVSLIERKARSPLKCSNCYQLIDTCPNCTKPIIKTIEKGVDTAIVTDIIKFAWEGALDVAVLVSSDRDYIPAVELLLNKGFKVINGYFPPQGMFLASKCWANIDMKKGMNSFSR